MANWGLCKLLDMHDLALRLHGVAMVEAVGAAPKNILGIGEVEAQAAVAASRGSDGEAANVVLSLKLLLISLWKDMEAATL